MTYESHYALDETGMLIGIIPVPSRSDEVSPGTVHCEDRIAIVCTSPVDYRSKQRERLFGCTANYQIQAAGGLIISIRDSRA